MSKTYAIADLHGRYDLLLAALERIESRQSGGKVIFLGDYVDRGPDSCQVVQTLIDGPKKPGWEWVCLKGNHEDMMVGAVRQEYEASWWIGNGGGNTLVSYGGEPFGEHVDWMAKLPLYHADGKRIYVHAGVDETIPMAEQTEKILVWYRVCRNKNYSHPEGYVVHGHTPFEDGPVILAGRANLDTGAVWTGRLAIAVFDDAIDGGPVEIHIVKVDSAMEEAA